MRNVGLCAVTNPAGGREPPPLYSIPFPLSLSLFCYTPLRPFVTRAFLHSAHRIMERSSIFAIPLSFRKRTSESRFFSGHSSARNFYHAVPALINGAGLHERSRDLSGGTTFHRLCGPWFSDFLIENDALQRARNRMAGVSDAKIETVILGMKV